MDNKKMLNLSSLTLKKYSYYFNDLRYYSIKKKKVSMEYLTPQVNEIEVCSNLNYNLLALRRICKL